MKIKNILQLIVAGFTAVLFSGCQDVIQVKLDEGAKLFVIDAFVNDLRAPQTIRVLTNDTYFSNREAPPVTDATVILKDLTANTQVQFLYTDKGNYIFNPGIGDTISKVDHQYELNVTIDGFTYSSLTTQKRTARIDSIAADYNEGGGGFGPANPFYFCSLYAKDRADNNADYYWVKAFRNDTLFAGSGDISLCIDGTQGEIKGLDVDSTDFTPPVTFLGFRTYQSGNTCKAEIHSISRATYFFLLQAVTQINNGGLFATTPENVKTNIISPEGAKTKSIGWFNMATVASLTKVIP